MAITIYKYTEYVPWDAVGVGVTRHGAGGGGICDLSEYYTKTELISYQSAKIHYSNIVYDGRMNGSIAGVANVTGRLGYSGEIRGLIEGVATVTGRLWRQGQAKGEANGIATVTGTLKSYYASNIEIYVTPDAQFPIDYLYYRQNGIENYVTDIPKADGVVSGGVVSWLTGLQFQLSPTAYYINGTLYTIASDTITLDPADDTFDRFDILVVDVNQNFTYVKGVPSAEPLKPTHDVLTQLELTSVYIPANAVAPDPLPTDEFIYNEFDSGEWVPSSSGVTVDWESVTNPYIGSYCIDVGALTNGDYLQFLASSPLDRADYETIVLNLKLKATIPTTSNRMVMTFLLNGVAVSGQYTLSFDRSTTSWQNIGVSFGAVTWLGTSFNQVRFTWIRSGGGSYDGVYMDYIKLETNIEQPPIQQSIQLMGDVNGLGLTGSPVITTLVTIPGLTAGQYGDATHIPMVTIDIKGRVTAIEEVAISIPEANTFDMSLSEDSLGVVTLLNDEDSPGNSKYYGTDAGGTKGYYDLPVGGDSLWEETTDDFITPVSSTGTGIIVDDIYIKDQSIYRPDGHLNHLYINAGNAIGTSSNDGGCLYLSGGNAIWGSAGGSAAGGIYLSPGNPPNNYTTGIVYFGNSTYPSSAIKFSTAGTEANINLQLVPKGTAYLYLGSNTSTTTIVSGLLTLVNDVRFSGDRSSYIEGCWGTPSIPTGFSVTLKGGPAAFIAGDYNGGNIYLYGGVGVGAGLRGDVYLGDGSNGYLKAKSSETNIVYYDTATGKLSYGGAPGEGTTYTFSMSLAESGGVVTLDNDEESPGNDQYYGTDSGGTKGWFDLPEGGGSLWEESLVGFLSPIGSAGMGISVGDVYIDSNTIFTNEGSSSHLIIQAGNAVGSAGTDAGNLVLKAGDAILNDVDSLLGAVYITPGNGYNTNVDGMIYLGGANFTQSAINIGAFGTQTNIGFYLRAKGSGSTYIGNAGTGTVNLYGSSIVLGANTSFVIGDRTLRTADGYVSHTTGYHLTIKAGDSYSIGDTTGGNLYLYSGLGHGTGVKGNMYFGTGSVGYLKAATTETYVVYYDTSTGLLSYGYVGEPGSPGGYTFAMSIDQASDDTVTLVNDEESPGNSQYYGTDGSGTKGWYDLPEPGTVYTFSMSLAESGGTVTLDNDSDTPGNDQYYGTNEYGDKGYYALPVVEPPLWQEDENPVLSPTNASLVGVAIPGYLYTDKIEHLNDSGGSNLMDSSIWLEGFEFANGIMMWGTMSDPGTPTNGTGYMWLSNSDQRLYYKDSNDVIYDLLAGGTLPFQTASYANPLNIDCTSYKDWVVTVTDDCTINLNNVSDGDSGMLELIIDGDSSGASVTITMGTMWTKKMGPTDLDMTDGADNIISWRAIGEGSTQEIVYTVGIIEV